MRGRGRVLMSAQICPVVPKLVKQAGFQTAFVDIDTAWPTPTAEQFVGALEEDVVAVIVSPLYGYLPEDWTPLLSRLEGRSLVLDLAQGLGVNISTELVRTADAIGFSFGLGKGMDTGGGLVLSKAPFTQVAWNSASVTIPMLAGLQGSIMDLLTKTRGYRILLSQLRDVEDTDLGRLDGTPFDLLPPSVYGLWLDRLPVLESDFHRARMRAESLARCSDVARFVSYAETYFGVASSHLRQVVRLQSATKRDAVIRSLRKSGIDCAPAGELLPADYMNTDLEDFPNATSFRADAIRLPFLGRMDDAVFRRFLKILEACFVEHLS